MKEWDWELMRLQTGAFFWMVPGQFENTYQYLNVYTLSLGNYTFRIKK